jgi:SAM-dependent methyltransferase
MISIARLTKTKPVLHGYVRSRLHGFVGGKDLSPCKDCICGLMVCVPSCPASHMLDWAAPSNADTVAVLAPYQGSPWANIDAMLDSAGFKPGDRVLDLGAGDARVLIRAIQRGASIVEGWELSSDVHAVGVQHISASFGGKFDDCDEVRYFLGDARSAKPFEFDIVTMFLLPYGLSVLGSWLQHCHRVQIVDGHSFNRPSRTVIVSQGWPLFPEQTEEARESENGEGLVLRNKVTVHSGAVMFVYS